MASYIILLPQDESRWDTATAEAKAEGYEGHARFAALLAERGHRVTGGAELTHSRDATTLRRLPTGISVTEGPFAETVEQITGFYSVETDDFDDLVECCKALLATEGVELEFSESGVRRIAEVSFQVNERTENIGARRLHTVLERLLETISYEAADRGGVHIKVDAEYVDRHLGELVKDEDLTRYIL